jgi:hypothetical protein
MQWIEFSKRRYSLLHVLQAGIPSFHILWHTWFLNLIILGIMVQNAALLHRSAYEIVNIVVADESLFGFAAGDNRPWRAKKGSDWHRHHIRFRPSTEVRFSARFSAAHDFSYQKSYLNAELVIIDEWGYLPMDREEAQLLFQVVASSYERRSLLITTNLEFSKWGGVFTDDQMAAAMIRPSRSPWSIDRF